jgi:hypothetical protein
MGEHLPLLHAMISRFPDSEILADDMQKTESRMALRESSCCMGPVKLARPRKHVTETRS